MEKKVLVLGAGSSGKAAAALAEKLCYETVLVSGDERIPESNFDFAVVSPGIPPTNAWFAELSSRGVRIISEMQFGVENLKRRGWRLLAVTGSKGKSSVVKLVADALGGVACGNYGLPVSAVDGIPGWAVVEVSSFMMETTDLAPGTFEAAAILNLQEDHLDRHGDKETYHALKIRLLSMARRRINGAVDIPECDSWFYEGTYFDNDVLSKNAAVAVALMKSAAVADERIREAFMAFEPLGHRMQTVCVSGGVEYIDDSKSTSLESLAAALRMCAPRRVRLVAGGLGKGENPENYIFHLTKRVEKVYLIGKCAEVFFSSWSGSVDCEICGTLENAVEALMREAVPGEIALLSPGAASYDQFKNFEERGEVFARLVKKKGNKNE